MTVHQVPIGTLEKINLSLNQQRIQKSSKKVNDDQGKSGARETLSGFKICGNI